METVVRRLTPWFLFTSIGLCACGGSTSTSPDSGLNPDSGFVIELPDAGPGTARDAGDFSPSLRGQNVTTADVGLLAQLEAALPGATTAGAKDALVQSFLTQVEAHGGTPLVTHDGGTEVAFIQYGAPSSGYSVAGDWNGFTAGQIAMTRVGGSLLYAADVNLPRTEDYRFKLVDGSNYFEDLRSHNGSWDQIDRGDNAWGQFNAQVYPELSDPAKGRLVIWRNVSDPTIGKTRDVYVYLPRAYDAKSVPTLPAIYFHDGNHSLTRVGSPPSGWAATTFSMVADSEFLAHPDESAVLVFVNLPDLIGDTRLAQYSFPPTTYDPSWPTPQGDQYVSFLKNTVVPKVAASFRVCPGAVDRGVSGASLGGFISGYIGIQASDTFGYVASQSGSYFFNQTVQTRLGQQPMLPLRWYVDTGCPDDNCDSNRELATDLATAGYPLTHIEQTNAQHDWAYWNNRLPLIFQDFHTTFGCTP
jgi:enterochelin esterase family protein